MSALRGERLIGLNMIQPKAVLWAVGPIDLEDDRSLAIHKGRLRLASESAADSRTLDSLTQDCIDVATNGETELARLHIS